MYGTCTGRKIKDRYNTMLRQNSRFLSESEQSYWSYQRFFTRLELKLHNILWYIITHWMWLTNNAWYLLILHEVDVRAKLVLLELAILLPGEHKTIGRRNEASQDNNLDTQPGLADQGSNEFNTAIHHILSNVHFYFNHYIHRLCWKPHISVCTMYHLPLTL